MYSSKSYPLNKNEFDYLLPVLRKNLHQSNDKYCFIANNIDCLEDMLNRLKGLYDNYNEIKKMVVYNCSKDYSLLPFREWVSISK